MSVIDTKRTALKSFAWDRKDLCIWLAACAWLLLQVVKMGDAPGLYLDAVNPDYRAVQQLFPNPYSAVAWVIAPPFLLQIYHGLPTVLLTAVSILITGTTGIVQHHVVNALYVFVVMACAYEMIRVAGGKKWVGALVLALIAGSPGTLTMLVTQYYVELFGAAACMVGAVLLCYYRNREEGFGYVGWAYFLLGVAFYSYYNYLFLLPGLLLAHVLIMAGRKYTLMEMLADVICGGILFAVGCSFYFLGYTQIVLGALALPGKLPYLFAAVLYGLLAVGYRLSRKPSPRALGGYVCAMLVLLGAWAAVVIPHILPILDDLSVSVDNSSLVTKIMTVVKHIYVVVVGSNAERLIYGEVVQQHTKISFALFLALMGAGCLHALWKKQWTDRVLLLTAGLGVYCLISLVVVSRMQPQHFVCFCFFMLLAAGFALVKLQNIPGNRLLKRAVVAVCLFVIGLNVVNQARIINQIQVTGGEKYFSYQINALSYDANAALENGEREIYTFKDWGFVFGFTYLTQNRIPVSSSLEEADINRWLEDGYTVVSCFWAEKDIPVYEELLTVDKATDTVEVEAMYEKSGEIAFYKATVTREK